MGMMRAQNVLTAFRVILNKLGKGTALDEVIPQVACPTAESVDHPVCTIVVTLQITAIRYEMAMGTGRRS